MCYWPRALTELKLQVNGFGFTKTKGAYHFLLELAGQTSAVVMSIPLLIRTIQPDQCSLKQCAQQLCSVYMFLVKISRKYWCFIFKKTGLASQFWFLECTLRKAVLQQSPVAYDSWFCFGWSWNLSLCSKRLSRTYTLISKLKSF